MALNIKSAKAEKLARELAKRTGETITDAVTMALEERRDRVARARRGKSLADELDEIAKRCAALPVLDPRSPDEILYDENGLPR
ncbi:MAG: PSK operon transcription factor [Alphaproteobacteria bacterium]|nr:PSK operon transcription factor [Alphaproteobacteria bacterium]